MAVVGLRSVAVLLLLLLLLAGCTSSSTDSSSSAPDSSASGGALQTVCLDAAMRPVSKTANGGCPSIPDAVGVSFNGNLGTYEHECVFVPQTTCDIREVTPGLSEKMFQVTGANLTGFDFWLNWTASSSATQTLTVGYMVMACGTCIDPYSAEQTGSSPIHVQETGLQAPLNSSVQIHIYVYNPQSFVTAPSVPAYAVVSVDQVFTIQGTALIEKPGKHSPAPPVA